MKLTQIIYTYKRNKGDMRPVITTALKLDTNKDKKIKGLSIGVSYCSQSDHVNKKIGKALAEDRAAKLIEDKNNKLSKDNDGRFYGTYIKIPVDDNVISILDVLQDWPIRDSIVLAISNINKFNQL